MQINSGSDSQIKFIGNSGEFAVVGEYWNSEIGQHISVQKFNSNGTIQGDSVTLISVNSYTQNIFTTGNSGEYMVTFQSADGHMTLQKFNSDGTVKDASVSLAPLSDNFEIITVGSSGEYVVTGLIWNGDLGQNYIYAQKYNSNGTAQGDSIQLDIVSPIFGYKGQITAVLDSGEYVITYSGQGENSESLVFVQKFNTDGTTQGILLQLQGEIMQLSPSHISFTSATITPRVSVIEDTGEYVVILPGLDNDGHNQFFVQKYNTNGVALGDLVGLEIGVPSYVMDPQVISVGSIGEYAVSFIGNDRENDLSVFVQKFNANGTIQGELTKVEGNLSSSAQPHHLASLEGSNDFILTWGEYVNSEYIVGVQKFNADGSLYAKEIQNTDSLNVQSNELGTVYLVNNNVTVANMADITEAADNQWNEVAIAVINQDTAITAEGLTDGTYSAYSVDEAGNLSDAAINSIIITGAIG